MTRPGTDTVDIAAVAAGRALPGLQLDSAGAPVAPLLAVDLTTPADPALVAAAAAALAQPRPQVLLGIAAGPLPRTMLPVAEALDTVLVPRGADTVGRRYTVPVDDPQDAARAVASTVIRAPRAAITFTALLRQTSALDVATGLAAESSAYSLLLAGPEFRRWRADRPARAVPAAPGPPVILRREGPRLCIELDRRARHNAFDGSIRDGLVDAFDLVATDPSIEHVELRGRGPSFCSGGDLEEFGTAPDPVTAHLIRLDRSVGARLHHVRDRVTPYLHGVCVGAGIEIPAFAARVCAHPDTVFWLPEVAMGLVPGAGGTVSITARIGRWRTAYLALTGARIDADTACAWGLVDQVMDETIGE